MDGMESSQVVSGDRSQPEAGREGTYCPLSGACDTMGPMDAEPSMRAAVYRGPGDVRVEAVPRPRPGPGEILLRVEACGVCGTDLKKVFAGLLPPPRIFGHEIAGVVAETGAGVTGWLPGDHVAATHHVPCRQCFFCDHHQYAQCATYKRTGTTAGFEPAGGGLAEYVRVMDWVVQGGLTRIPDDVPLELGAFLEPVNTCLKAVRKARIGPEDVVLVLGLGSIGLWLGQLAQREGAWVVGADPVEFRRDWAAGLEIDVCAPSANAVAAALSRRTSGRGADVALVAAPRAEAVSVALQAIRPGGTVLLFAHTRSQPLTLDVAHVGVQEKTLIGSYSTDPDLNQEVASLVFSQKLAALDFVTHRFPLEQAPDALALAARPSDGVLKVMVCP